MGFTQYPDGTWVNKDGEMLPEPDISQEAHDSRVQNIIDAGIIIGSG